jgi:protein SCO1/2
MRKYGLLAVLVVLLGTACALNAEPHSARGVVVQVGKSRRTLVVSCDAIPGYMDPMEMSFTVRSPKALEAITPGTTIQFTIEERGHVLYAEDVQPVASANFESEPMEAGGLTVLQHALDPSSAALVLGQGQKVPDFALTDQAGQQIHLSSLHGKVVLLTFGYSRCPNPDYCYRLSNNLGKVERRFSSRAGRDLVLVTIAIDPEHDHGEALSQYAAAFHADPAVWHFLTGPVPEIKQVAGMFGMNFWRDEGLLTHSLHTVVIGREGNLAANLEGNQFTAQQLGDLVKTEMNRRQ